MRTVKETETVEVKVRKEELFEGKWLNLKLLSNKLSVMEKSSNVQYKSLRNKLYNCTAGGKYNVRTMAGIKCIDIEEPMVKDTVASLVLKIKVEG